MGRELLESVGIVLFGLSPLVIIGIALYVS